MQVLINVSGWLRLFSLWNLPQPALSRPQTPLQKHNVSPNARGDDEQGDLCHHLKLEKQHLGENR